MKLMYDLYSVNSLQLAINCWTMRAGSASPGYRAPDGSLTAWRVEVFSSGVSDLGVYRDVPGDVASAVQAFVGRTYTAGVWAWADVACFGNFNIFLTNGQQSVFSVITSLNTVPKFINGTGTFTSVASDGGFLRLHLFVNSAPPGSIYYVWRPHVAHTPEHLDLLPEWNFEDTSRKIESEHRARGGRRYVYKWGSYSGLKFGLSFVDSATRHTVNDSFWANNQFLFACDTLGTFAYNVQLTNDRKPFGKPQMPYDNFWNGVIELEGY